MTGPNPYNPFDAPGQYSGIGPKNYKRSDDRIFEDVNEQLTRHHLIDASDIEVSVQDGEVTLRGSVDFRQTKRLAEDIAENVSGVNGFETSCACSKHRRPSRHCALIISELNGRIGLAAALDLHGRAFLVLL
jgi:hypothetical protein